MVGRQVCILLCDCSSVPDGSAYSSTVHELFRSQARLTPDAIAVVSAEGTLTYGELDRRSGVLATYLRGLGVGPETLVGLCVERSLEMVVGLLGILKAGGAYVPLDPDYPADRLSFMVSDTCAPVVLTLERLGGSLPASFRSAARVVFLDRDWARIETAGATEAATVSPAVGPDNLCYVTYTSGSTGRPKGVAVPHRGVVRLVTKPNYMTISREDVFLQFAPLAFDASTLEIWGPLLNGAKLVIAPPGTAAALDSLGDLVREHGVTTLWLTAGLFSYIVSDRIEILRGVRQLLFGGDVVPVQWVAKAFRELEGCKLYNGYGPTENTTFTTVYPVEGPPPPGRTIPIGRPISGTTVYVLDENLDPVGVGEEGELYTGGHGLARGYHNRPDLTAERFVPDPFSTAPGARLYRTGDLVRRLPDGNIEFVGRVDYQVKIRGFRVELGEIEANLTAHPGVKQAVAVVHQTGEGDKRIDAYLLPSDAEAARVLPEELPVFLRERLPEWMIPSTFTVVEEFPLDPNGKIDRRSLPPPATPGAIPAGHTVSPEDLPRTPTEETIASIWCSVLGVDRVGRSDDFFALGGHSLLATRVAVRIRDAFGVAFPLEAVFECPTLARLAERVERSRLEATGGVVPALGRAPREGPLPLSYAQRRLWFLGQMNPESPVYNVTATVRLHGPLDVDALRATFTAVVRRHETLRTRFTEEGGEPYQVIEDRVEVPFRTVDLTGVSPDERESAARAAVAEEARRPFDLASCPLLRVTLVCLGDREHLLAIVMHHIVCDGWSMAVLVRELTVLYGILKGLGAHGREGAEATGPDPGGLESLAGLPPLEVQYADYAVWQREWLQGPALEVQLEYWREALAGLPPLLELPTDRPRPDVESFRGRSLYFSFPAGLTSSMRRLARDENVTLFMILVSGLAAVLHHRSGRTDPPLGVAIANRTRTELENLIGFFVNTLVFRPDLSGDPTWREILARTKRSAFGAYAHQDLPFDKLVEALRPERSLSHMPFVQVLFAFQNVPAPRLSLAGLTVSDLEVDKVDTGTSKADLVFTIEEWGETLRGVVQFNTDIFDEATVNGLVGDYIGFLESAAGDPGRKLSDLLLALRGTPVVVSRETPVARGLPVPEYGPSRPLSSRSAAQGAPEREATEIETAVARIWCEVLGVDRVGPDEDFFDLGGHSLLALRVVSRLRRAFGIEVKVRDLFEHPTVAGLAGLVERTLAGLTAESKEG